MFDAVKPLFDSLGRIIGQSDYYRYRVLVTMNVPKLPEHNNSMLLRYGDHWRFVIQRMSFLASLLVYLESGCLATRMDVCQLLGGRF